MVLNVTATPLHDGSVIVTWDSVNTTLEVGGTFEVRGYIIYYDQQRGSNQPGNSDGNTNVQTRNISYPTNSQLIENLTVGARYRFQVAVIAELGGDIVIGEKSMISTVTVVTFPVPITTHEASTSTTQDTSATNASPPTAQGTTATNNCTRNLR